MMTTGPGTTITDVTTEEGIGTAAETTVVGIIHASAEMAGTSETTA